MRPLPFQHQSILQGALLQVRGGEIVFLLPALRPASWWHGALYDFPRRRSRHIFITTAFITISAVAIIRRRSWSPYNIIDSPPAQLIAYGRCLLDERWVAWQRAVGPWDAGGYWHRGHQAAQSST